MESISGESDHFRSIRPMPECGLWVQVARASLMEGVSHDVGPRETVLALVALQVIGVVARDVVRTTGERDARR